ncbi:methylenetetrahydrofolate reductase [Clostridioides mangenotii]|uniref:methylenetetrahydrofolate reductase n=1 Tax=Metaclostridioides mangenotii TaxID=1540 RepID=UPI001C11A9B8|nr:methylenetetrahydrofolate reductase [Clostridioides mangenotii]MBU5307324.1 methylenetetrahydrofolate reductase [Clostridioides mangenotii]
MSRLEKLLEDGKFVITAEIAPPKGIDFTKVKESAELLRGKVDAINITDFQLSVMRATSLSTCKVIKDMGIDPILQMTGRDRNRIALQGEMLSAGVFGIENILALTGDHTSLGDHPQAKAVFDLDSVGILQAGQALTSGFDMSGNELKGTPEFYFGAAISPGHTNLNLQTMKMRKKIITGAKFFQTQAVFDIDVMRNFREITKDMEYKILCGVLPLKSPRMARMMNDRIPGIFVPEDQIERLESVGKENWKTEGLKIAAELIRELKNEKLCDGIHIMTIGAEDKIPELLEYADLL